MAENRESPNILRTSEFSKGFSVKQILKVGFFFCFSIFLELSQQYFISDQSLWTWAEENSASF